jgi:D-sedoheptulose 7-phosphate isomerase
MYSKQYRESFLHGIENSIFEISTKNVETEHFFKKLNSNIKEETRIFFYGNGASMAFASHMSLDWHKNGKIESHTLSDVSLLTAFMNDYSKEEMFAEHLKSMSLNKNDIVCTISSSGNSENVIGAIKYANSIGSLTLGLSGLNVINQTRNHSKFSIFVPLKTYGQVECAHQLFLHLWLDYFMGIKEWERSESQNMNVKNFKL